MHMGQDLTNGVLEQQKLNVRYVQRKKVQVVVSRYRKSEDIFFTNSEGMSVLIYMDDAF